jgi:hypothetical protein
MAAKLPSFTAKGVLPPGDYPMTLAELRDSFLVSGEGVGSPAWDVAWRRQLVDNLEIVVRQLFEVGIERVFIDGSFVEKKDRPNDVDAYFECSAGRVVGGALARELNALDPHRVWTWHPSARHPDPATGSLRLPMWHQYHVDLFPHFPGLLSGILGPSGQPLPLPEGFRQQRLTFYPKGIVRIVKERS